MNELSGKMNEVSRKIKICSGSLMSRRTDIHRTRSAGAAAITAAVLEAGGTADDAVSRRKCWRGLSTQNVASLECGKLVSADAVHFMLRHSESFATHF